MCNKEKKRQSKRPHWGPACTEGCGTLQAAQLRGDTLEVKAQLLRELLTESNAFGYLMGSGGPGATGGQYA